MIRSNSSLTLNRFVISDDDRSAAEKRALEKEKINKRVNELSKIVKEQGQRQATWDALLSFIKEMEDSGTPYLPSMLRHLHTQMWNQLITSNPTKKKNKEDRMGEKEGECWDWDRLGVDVLKVVLSFVPFDDGNWLSVLRVNRAFYKAGKEVFDPNRFYYGEKPIFYCIRKKRLESLKYLLKDPRVNPTGASITNEPKLAFRNQPSLIELARDCAWTEGLQYLLQCERIDSHKLRYQDFLTEKSLPIYLKYKFAKEDKSANEWAEVIRVAGSTFFPQIIRSMKELVKSDLLRKAVIRWISPYGIKQINSLEGTWGFATPVPELDDQEILNEVVALNDNSLVIEEIIAYFHSYTPLRVTKDTLHHCSPANKPSVKRFYTKTKGESPDPSKCKQQ